MVASEGSMEAVKSKKNDYHYQHTSFHPRQSTEHSTNTNDHSPPRTPQDQIGKAARLKGIKAPRNRPSIRDAFDNQNTKIVQRDRSDSNGLSWSPKNARNSVVDNILLSLDNFGSGQESSASYTKSRSINHTETTIFDTTARLRIQPTPSISSSEYSSLYDSPQTKGSRHRSNSNANFQSALGRIDSVRANDQEEETFRPSGTYTVAKSRGIGRDSGSSSLDLERPDPKYRKNRRSQSFDHGYTRMALRTGYQDPSPQEQADSTLPLSTPIPTRLQPSAALRPGAPNADPPSNVHRRNRSTQSPDCVDAVDSSELTSNKIPETPPYESDAYGIKPVNILPSSGIHTTTQAKENQKPGFFRKMFGSSKQTNDIVNQKKYLQRPPNTTYRQPSFPLEEGLDQSQFQSAQKVSIKERPMKDMQPLNKKTSFFRRRRKSLQDAPVPQVPQFFQDKDEPPATTYPESTSSLQKVMDQYYDSQRGLDSRGSIANSKRKNSMSASGIFTTIRTVAGPTAKDNGSINLKNQARNSLEQDSKKTKNVEKPEHKRSASNGSKFESREKVKSPTGDRIRPNPAHARTQSDIDKDLPRLPIDYTAMKSEVPKEVPTSKYNHTTSKPPSRDSAVSVGQMQPSGSVISKRYANDSPSPMLSPRHEKGSCSPVETKVIVSDTKSRAISSEARSTPIDFRSSPSQSRATPVEILDEDNDDDELADETKEALLLSVQDDDDEPTTEHRLCAQKLFNGTSGIDRAELAPWLGEADLERGKVRQVYMELFDWKDMSILAALRSFCNHIQLKGETQQVDRLLDALSRRWCECNSRHGFKATDVVHTICYSMLLLNTDLHVADIEQKMTRTQFIRNTLPTIRRVVADAAPHAFDNARHSILPPRRQTEPGIPTSGLSIENTQNLDTRPTYRLQNQPSDHSGYDTINDHDDCGPLVKSPFQGKLNGWEAQIELVLKDIYLSIRNQRLPLSGEEDERKTEAYNSTLSLSAATGSMLRRTNSLLSKAGSETIPARGRISETRIGSRWTSKGRSRQRLYPSSLAHSRTSFDDDQSAISPSMSSMWSKPSLGKTSMSITSLASGYPGAEYQRSIGFANALSQAITRNDSADESTEEFLRAGPLLEDESIELEGAPWAKEGILKHKHHLESVDKKAKDRNWNECFAVIEKGWIRLFQFNMNSKSVRQRSQKMIGGGGVVGGGNWTETAQSFGHFLLRHTIASALPPPGYSKARPHVWALSLPTGAVHLFQAGTPEIVREFVSTANYWSARLSKEPLVGGVSNIEYGWSDRVINPALMDEPRSPSITQGRRPSMSQSIRTSFDQGSSRPRLPGDKVIISDWMPPTQSMTASQLLEVDQLRALQLYVANIEEELRKHNQLHYLMSLAFTNRQSNHTKAMNNWEAKSSYLLREIVKFSTYLESLQFAQQELERVKADKRLKEEQKEKASGQTQAQGQIHELAGSDPQGDSRIVHDGLTA